MNLLAMDSEGATESQEISSESQTETVETESTSEEHAENKAVIEGSESEEIQRDESEQEPEADPELYDFGEFQASLDDLKRWKEADEKRKSYDKDYTQKSQANAELRKQTEQKSELLDQKLEMFSAIEGEVEALLLGDLAGVDLDKIMDEHGTDEYLRTQREIQKRLGLAQKIGEKVQKANETAVQEAGQQLQKMLGWDSADKRESDQSQIIAYVKESGIPDKVFNGIRSPHVIQAILEAARYREMVKRKTETVKKVARAPKVAKSNKAASGKPKTLAERMYGSTKK